MGFKTAPLLKARTRRASVKLLADTEARLNGELGHLLGPITTRHDSTHIAVWRDDEGKFVQFAGYFAFQAEDVQVTIPVIVDVEADEAFKGKGFSPAFRAAWFESLTTRFNQEMARGWEFNHAGHQLAPHLSPWETVRYDSFEPDSFRVRVIDERSGDSLREELISYKPVGYDEVEKTIACGVIESLPLRTSDLLAYGAILVASQDERVALAYARIAADGLGGESRSFTPELWLKSNYGPGTHRQLGRVRGAVTRKLGTEGFVQLSSLPDGFELAGVVTNGEVMGI